MKGHLHLAMGAYAGVMTSALLVKTGMPEQAAMMTAGAVVIGSAFPDIDIATSMIGAVVRPASALIHAVLGHRGLFHTPFLYGLVYLFFKMSGRLTMPVCGFLFGVSLHLIMDMMTFGGIMLLYPFTRFRFRVSPFRSGSLMNYVYAAALAALVTVMLPQIIK